MIFRLIFFVKSDISFNETREDGRVCDKRQTRHRTGGERARGATLTARSGQHLLKLCMQLRITD